MSQEFDLGRIRGGSGPAGPPGAVGPTGPRGPVGPAPDIAIGSVEMAAAGSDPWVRRRAGSPDVRPVLDFGLPVSGDMAASIYDPHGLQQDIFAYADERAGLRPASCVVAAADSVEQNRADFICSGQADQITLRRALSTLTQGGCLLLLAGTYVLDGTALAADADGDQALLNISTAGISICGEGAATVLKLASGVAGAGDSLLLIKATAAGFGVRDLTIDGNSAGNAGTVTGLYLTLPATSDLRGLSVQGCSGRGAEIISSDSNIHACRFSTCGQGLRVNGSVTGMARVSQCRFQANSCGLYLNSGRLMLTNCSFTDNLQQGLYGIGGKYLQMYGCRLYGQPQGVDLVGCHLCHCCFNLITREADVGDWSSGEFAMRLSGCTEPLVLGNFLLGSALQTVNCSSPYLALSGTNWNIS